jgi:hypothetical protein
LATVLWATPVTAQVTIGADAALNSAYNWRGLSLTNKPVIQPDLWLSAYGFTAGVWANIEPTKYDGATDISETGGRAADRRNRLLDRVRPHHR